MLKKFRIGMGDADKRSMNKTFHDIKEWALIWGSFALFVAFEVAMVYGFLKWTGTV